MCLNVFELRHLLCIGNFGSGNVTSILWQVEKTAGEMGAAPESAEKFTQAAWEPFTVLCVVFSRMANCSSLQYHAVLRTDEPRLHMMSVLLYSPKECLWCIVPLKL